MNTTDNRDHINQLLLIEPSDLNEVACVEVRMQLLDATKKIDAQLSAKKRTFANGDAMTTVQYQSWRAKAITAKNHIESQYRKVNERMKDLRRAKHGSKNT